jgi:iron-only hydrogenase group A
MIQITINGKKYKTEQGKTILEVCRENGIDVPALCYHPDLDIKANCRMCLVKIEGVKGLVTACSERVCAGYNIITESPEIIRARKINLELLFSQHKEECFDCVWNYNCELLRLAKKYKGVKINRFEDRKTKYPVIRFGNVIEFDSSKCIDCRNCIDACHKQGVDFLEIKEKGSLFQVVPSAKKNIDCIYCGQCINHCPAGAFETVDEFESIEKPLKHKDKIVVAQFAPSIRSSIGEEFGLPGGKVVTGQLVSALRKAGFSYVFDTSVGADFTTTSEAAEVVERIKENRNLPVLTSCCPSWVKYVEQRYPQYIKNISSTRSPQVILGGLVKTYWAEREKINPEKIYVVSIMPCTSKKFEIERPQVKINGIKPVDYVLTTREFARLLMRKKINLAKLKPEKADAIFGSPSGAGVIYGATGGVMESAFRTAYEKLTGKILTNVDFKPVRGMKGIKEAEVKIGNDVKKIAVVNGLGYAKKFLQEKNIKDYACIEVMACPGGCIGGGGQPIPTSNKIRVKRAEALYSLDKTKKIRKAHENPIVKKVYKDYFSKHPVIAHQILHTSYNKKKKYPVIKL